MNSACVSVCELGTKQSVTVVVSRERSAIVDCVRVIRFRFGEAEGGCEDA